MEPRFNVVAGAGQITVNGNVAPSPTSTGVTTLELTSRDLSLRPSIQISGVISDGTNPSSQLALRAGFANDSENHAGIIRVTGQNTYSGKTTVSGATLEFNSIADADGTASALGAPDNASDGTGESAAVSLENGANVSVDEVRVGYCFGFDCQGSVGVVTVDNSTFSAGNLILSRDDGNATVNVSNGGRLVTSGSIDVGIDGRMGVINLDGPEARWDASGGDINLGQVGGEGTINVKGGGVVVHTGGDVNLGSDNFSGATLGGKLLVQGPAKMEPLTSAADSSVHRSSICKRPARR